MKTTEDFEIYFSGELTPTLQQLESERKKGVQMMWLIILSIVVGIGLAIATAVLRIHFVGYILAGLVFLAGTIVFSIKLRRIKRDVKIHYKENVIKKIVEFIDPHLNYNATSCISQGEFEQSKIFLQRAERYKGDDLVQGTIGKTAVRFSEIHSEYYTTDKDGKRKYHTIFKGIFFIADFNKDFIGETIVLPDTAEKLFGKLGKFFQKMNISRPKLIKLEDPIFEKAFAVYGTDQVEARYILTPALMSRIMEFKKKSGRIHLSFLHSSVYIAISERKNLFEPPFMKSMLDFDIVEGYFNYLQLSVQIVEDLNLNTRIWSKE
ncbi:MAG: DUF3137 domain-containing protein [Crocinitomicaceae bacterium]|nr:DUF3137 domain-containing protein [Crocinitomicaceae bacterium]